MNIKYNIGTGSAANIFALAGPQIAFDIGDKVRKPSDFKDQAAEWTLKSSNLSVNAGLGLATTTHFQVTANYNVGVGKTGDIIWKGVKKGVENHKAQVSFWRIGVAYFS